MPGERELTDILDENLALAARSAADELGADFESLKRLRPWAFVNDLIPYQLQSAQATGDLGIDRYLLERAKADGKPVEALEDIDYIAKRFNASPLEVQIDALRQFLKDREHGTARYTAMVNACLGGDLRSMEEIVQDQWGPFPDLATLFIYQRNRNWLPRIRDLRKSSTTVLVVVGCAHLVGESNLLQLLEQRGAAFEQM